MKGIVESWDGAQGRGWIRPVPDPDRPPPRVAPSSKVEVDRKTLSPSARGTLKPGQEVGFIYRAPDRPDGCGRAEAVVVISEPKPAPAPAPQGARPVRN